LGELCRGEGIAMRLILALYRTGHPADALAHFDAFRRRLADQLGADPGPELTGLQLRMLRREVPAISRHAMHGTSQPSLSTR
jgi:DNA-binding SARP family transcriptional activator